ncbi:Protein FARS-2 a [Aphelenchoides avenae]|nr:Protein FARS-2 a [Aphelenchus avenae]
MFTRLPCLCQRVSTSSSTLLQLGRRCYSIAETPKASLEDASTEAAKPSAKKVLEKPDRFELDGSVYVPDEQWNLTSNVTRLLDRRLLVDESNPLRLLKDRIIDHFHATHRKPGNRSPTFTVCERENRVVTVFENFDSLLTPADHVSRRPSDTYYVNKGNCLRAHTSAHQHKLIQQGFNAFLAVGDVYRRDVIDRTHYPCFHQMEGVRLYSADELFGTQPAGQGFALFEPEAVERTPEKQERLSADASKALEISLKCALEDMCRAIFRDPSIQMRWVDAYFPFTHPSFELEVLYGEKWIEVLGCGVMEQKLLDSAGAADKVGWAFGLGLERLAMVLYGIPDIRLFWSRDSGFLNQFKGKTPQETFKYKPISAHPQLYMDVSFWLPAGTTPTDMASDAMDTIRNVGGDLVEQVELVDEFFNKKTQRHSQCFRVVYRSHERALTKEEVNVLHDELRQRLVEDFRVEIR